MTFGKVADLGAGFVTWLLGLKSGSRWSVRVADHVNQATVKVDSLRFVATSHLLLWRALDFASKEPETIQWIDAMAAGEILWDIGANIGTYTLYAASRGVRVFAFEPEAGNFSILNRNVLLNGFTNVTAYPVAVADKPGLNTLRVSDTRPGAALHAYGTNYDYRGREFAPVFQQGAIAVTLDQLAFDFGLPVPQHVKIDVDGLEAQIVCGGTRLFAHPAVRSVLIELNDRLDRPAIEQLLGHGFRMVGRGKGVPDATNAIFERPIDAKLRDEQGSPASGGNI